MPQKLYEEQFIKGIALMFEQAGASYKLFHQLGEPYRPLIKGSSNSEADGVMEVGSGILFVEIDKKDYASDNVVKYHRALSLDLLTFGTRGRRLGMVQAFITKNMKPLRVKNAKHMGSVLSRDFGVVYISAESPAESDEEAVPALLNQLREPLLRFARNS